MAITNYPNGAGGSLGSAWATCKPLLMSGNIWYVHSGTGTNAASPAGQNREKPLATLQQAITNAAANDIIVCLSGHMQTITSNISFGKRVIVVGEGSAAGLPTVIFTPGASVQMMALDAAGIELHNIKFAQSTVANAFSKVTTATTDNVLNGCYFECGALDDAENLNLNGATRFTLKNTTFLSVATLLTAQPHSAVLTVNALTDIILDGLVISAGTVGYSNYAAWDSSGSAITRLHGLSVSLLLGADMSLESTTTGRLNVQTATGGSRVRW